MSSLTLPWAIAGFLHPFYTFSPAHRRVIRDTFIWTFLGFSVTVLPQVLRFRAGVFYRTGVFYLALLPHILVRFCDSDVGRSTPSRILLCAYPLRVVPSGWRMVLNYSYCRYKTICLSVVPVSHNRVKTKLFNMFQPTYPFSKTIKTIWTELVNKYCLKLLSLNENVF